MPQFSGQELFGYKVFLRPTDPFRKAFRIRLPHLNLFLIPYLWGTHIMFELNIKATKSALPTVLGYEWQLYKEENEKPIETGSGAADMTAKRKHDDTIDLGHFSDEHKYHLNMKIETTENESGYYTVVDFETSSRTSFQLRLLATLFAVIGGVIGGVIGAVITRLIDG